MHAAMIMSRTTDRIETLKKEITRLKALPRKKERRSELTQDEARRFHQASLNACLQMIADLDAQSDDGLNRRLDFIEAKVARIRGN